MTLLVMALLCVTSHAAALQGTTLIVDQAGNGDFRTIQEALDAAPGNRLTTILVRKGTYREKLFITKSMIAVIGEDRERTRIVFPELRSNWIRDHDGNDWGSAVVNIADNVSDLILGNLTIHNNYGSLYGSHDHQFAIRGFRATRISLLYCTVIADGGDTVSLWDSTGGMYYHAFCSFEGWVDYVCPRGWCYVTDSRFFGHNRPSASIWHDGSQDKNQKFVIRNSTFDGVPGFPLGRHHRDAQIYLLDCTFSENMADRPIYSPKSPNTIPWIWGTRHYFFNCSREGGDYSWFSNNLSEAEGAPTPSTVTAVWTFDGKWDPERTLPSVLPFAALPQPRNGAYDVSPTSVVLAWTSGRDAKESRVFFGSTNPPPRVTSTTASQYRASSLQPGTEYFWRIETVGKDGTVAGDIWTFRTLERNPSEGNHP